MSDHANMGGEVVADSCDSGFVLIHPGPGGDQIMWRIDSEGKMIWSTQMTNLSNETAWWETTHGGYHCSWFNTEAIARGRDGTFILAGQFTLSTEFIRTDPYIIKFRDPSLECPELYTITTTLLLPICVAWRRTRRTRTPA